MGLFSFIRKKKDNTSCNENASQHLTIPTVKPSTELFSAFDEIFFREMATIKDFSKEDIRAMHKMITNGDGGYLNQFRYHKAVFQKFFKGKEWTWPEFERWLNIFERLGEYPVKWSKYGCRVGNIKVAGMLELLKVSELKEILKDAGLRYPRNAKKTNLIDILSTSPSSNDSIRNSTAYQNACSEYHLRRNYWLYETLMRTIAFRAKSLYERTHQSKLGITKRKLLIVFEHDRKFIDLALAENPNALTPLFPTDLTMWRAEVMGVD